jgi:phosphoribosylanthranilate isomerase|uniref:phosphoribosylanthranilate isomerase n=1 Tax=Cephaloticoccus sp. TaxID=1985742 RepID=UPI00404ACE6C
MIDGFRFKVCGLTSLVDADFADKCGADYLGFNLFSKSPRYVSLEQYKAMSSLLPDRKKVAVSVEPSISQLLDMKAAGFDLFQIHYRASIARDEIAAWSGLVGADRLWLAPKLPPDIDITPEWLGFAKYFQLDTFSADVFGGSGETGDWAKFARHRSMYPQKHWILAGGLNPENLTAAIRASGTKFVDVNSGVETSPGVKDQEKLKQFVLSLHRSRAD